MKSLTSIILTDAFIGTLNLVGLAGTAHPKQLHTQAAFISQHFSSTPVTEANDKAEVQSPSLQNYGV